MRCTAINETATLRLIKRVVNDNGHGGSGTAARTPLPPRPGLQHRSRSRARSPAGVQCGGQAHAALTETGPAGTLSVGGRGSAPRQTTTLTLNASETGVCVFTNDDQAAHLTLVKQVENGTTGGTATPANWTLAAAGPTPIQAPQGPPP
jgi:hypothetical protein